ncbi:MAG: anti-sigma factor RsiW [Gammaproteobacteria bacterium]|jgi:anti-sigma factor RsiW
MSNGKSKKLNSPLSLIKQDLSTASCETLEGFIVDYIDNNLPHSQHFEFEQHLNQCPNCKHYVENHKKSLLVSKSVFPDDSPSEHEPMPEALVQAILVSSSPVK